MIPTLNRSCNFFVHVVEVAVMLNFRRMFVSCLHYSALASFRNAIFRRNEAPVSAKLE